MRLYLPGGLLKRADADLADLTTSERTGEPYWDLEELDVLVVPLCPEPSPDDQAAIRRRLVTADAADEARYTELLSMRDQASTTFERMWIDTELARYGENPTTEEPL
jgi:hypothetical protein